MNFLIKKILFAAIFNSCLFVLLLIGIQNSANRKKVNLIFSETINLPISFIIGISFVSGSITASLLTNHSEKSKE